MEIDAHLNRTIRNCPAWRHKDDPLRSEPCVGKVLSFTLQTDLPELGIRGHRRISVLVGVAPLYRDSGDFTGAPRIWGGRSKVRHVLHMATVAAIRYDAVIRSFHERLIRAGEKVKVTIVVAMHKLLVILNAMVKNDTAWRRMAAGA